MDELTRLRAEVERLKADAARLDWLETLANVKIWESQQGRWHLHLDRDERSRLPITSPALRTAIDNARK